MKIRLNALWTSWHRAKATFLLPRRTGAAARKLVDELYEEHGSYSQVIDKLKADESIDESVCKVELQIANARLWEDKEKLQAEK